MKVKRLKMNSFRGISDLTLDFDHTELTVLIGINGVGKSSILDCLAILLSQLTAWIQVSIDFMRYFSEPDISPGREETKSEITVLFDNSQEAKWTETKTREESRKDSTSKRLWNLLSPFIESIAERRSQGVLSDKDWKEASQVLSEELIRGVVTAWSITEEALQDLLLDSKIKQASQALTENIIIAMKAADADIEQIQKPTNYIRNHLKSTSNFNIPLVVYYPVNRAVIDTPLEISEERSFKQVDAYEQAFTGGKIDFKSFFEWFRNREDFENELRRDETDYRDRQLKAVREAIASLMPDFSNLRVRRSPLRMTVTKQAQELIVNQLSDGEKCLLAMVGDLARRLAIANPGLSNPLQGSGVVLIDEIELHLHPKWQREIIPALTRTFPNCQFIVTTHSPQVISNVKPDSIYLLEKTPNGIVAKHPESSFGRDSNRILEDLMGVPERPQQIKDSLLELFRLIDEGNIDGARALRQRLATEIGVDEPEFVRADVLIRRKEILNR